MDTEPTPPSRAEPTPLPDFDKEFEAVSKSNCALCTRTTDFLLRHRFGEVFKNWIQYARSIDWRQEFPDELKDVPGKLQVVSHLLQLHVGKLYKRLEGDKKYGYLPKLARASRGSIAFLPAESFCERVISCGNNVMDEGNTSSQARRPRCCAS